MANEGNPTLNQLMLHVLTDSSIDIAQKKELIDELRKASPPKHDRWIYRYTIWFLGLAVLFAIVALFILSTNDHEVPEAIVAIGSAAVGALAGLLAPSGSSGDQ